MSRLWRLSKGERSNLVVQEFVIFTPKSILFKVLGF